MEKSAKTQVLNSQEEAKNDASEKAQNFSQAFQLVTSAALPMVLYTAVKLKLFEIIADAAPEKNKLSALEIASKLQSKNPEASSIIDRMLCLLSSYSVFTYDVVEVASSAGGAASGGGVRYERVYGLSPVGEFFLPNEEGNSIGNMVELLQDRVTLDNWYELGNCILEGGTPANRLYGMSLFEYAGKDARFNELANKGMAGRTKITMELLLEEYKGFDDIETLVDVGGGLGTTLHSITSKYPSIKGINFDLPHVVKNAPSYPGVTHIEGDMFESVPKGDAILLNRTLHDWSDSECLTILKNCFKAIPDNGKVIVFEFILPSNPDTNTNSRSVYQIDAVMMIIGGKERSEADFEALAIGAGFKGIRSKIRVGTFGVIEMYK
ncbi:OLC1v1007857C1 [Oldenlandia corymbosa var. corymbosa]|uniref:OLC1v1007857C1 n=1 Tax=Oldenlandia corymbosa var. corymbosa TaxID=529605 RepID=A0AAV1DKR3_OLDCO|nr:OLC1v1007857C1 [Oldenlandia corymbosa var. corymbosa]